MRKIILVGVGILASLVIVGEGFARLSGLTDFPLYHADSRIGYIPAPSQSGSFMATNDWAFNEFSMGTPRPFAVSEATDILLVGDSVVYGGNPYKQQDRLGPQLEAATGATVWPISAGSWGLQNELTWLADHSNVAKSVDHIVFVLNSGDYGLPSSWRSEESHPRYRPTSSLWYLVTKYLLKPVTQDSPADLIVQPRDWRADFAAFAASVDTPITVLLYPSRDPSDDDDLALGIELALLGADSVVPVSEDPAWSEAMYRDAIHPTAAGTSELARIIAESI